MPPPVTLACSRCGRPVSVPDEAAAQVPRCARCAPAAPTAFDVRSLSGRASLDGAALVERLRSGQLRGTDWLMVEGRPMLIAAHPAFAALFARGEIAEPPPPPPPAPAVAPVALKPHRPALPWGRMALGLAGLGMIGALAAVGFANRDALQDLARGASEVVKAPTDEPPRAPPKPKEDPAKPPPDPLAGLAAAVGPVEEPVGLLVARAMAEAGKGTPEGAEAALELARRAVARSTTDADAVALLAVLAAWSGTEPSLTTLAGERAVELGKGGPATQLGRAALALGNGDANGAEAAVAACTLAGDLLCREVAARAQLAEEGKFALGIAALDALAEAWPQNVSIRRAAALAAAKHDTADAKRRLAALKLEDPEVLGARGELALRDGDSATAAGLAAKLGASAPVSLRIGVARAALARGDTKAILALVDGVEGDERQVKLQLRLLEAQARYLRADKDKAELPAAKEAVTTLLALGRTDPAVAQVRALVAHLEGNRAEEAKAWDSMDTALRTGPELARVLKTQAALMLDARASGSEIQPVAEAARAADPADPYTHVWVIHVHLLGHANGKALDAMRQAIKQVDGQAARRRGDLVTLETGSPAKGLRALVVEALGNEATYTTQLPLATGVASWLAGDIAAAKAAIDTHPRVEEDPDALALRARVRALAGDASGAGTDWARVAALRPKESAWLLASLSAEVQAGRARAAAPLAALVRASKNVDALAPALLAEVAAANGDHPGAVALLETAVAMDPLDIRARARLTELRSGK